MWKLRCRCLLNTRLVRYTAREEFEVVDDLKDERIEALSYEQRFTAAAFKAGRYTDNIGDCLVNIALFQIRIDTMLTTIKQEGKLYINSRH